MRYRMVTHVVGHIEHYADDQIYIDFASDKLEVIDNENGECRSVEMFVSILPCSHYTYCEAVWSQSKQDLIKACENALHFYGGIPMAIVPDNLKAATRSFGIFRALWMYRIPRTGTPSQGQGVG